MTTKVSKQIKLSTTWSLISKVSAQAVTFITTIYLAKFLGVSDFGAINFGMLTVGLLDNIVDFGFLSAIVREKQLSEAQLSTSFWFLFFLCTVGILSLFLYSKFYVSDTSYSSVLEILIFGLVFIPIQSITRGLLSRDLKLDSVAKYELFGGLIRNLLAFLGAYYGYGVKGFIYGFLCERLFVSFCLVLHTRWTPKFVFQLASIKKFIAFGLANTLSRIIWYLSTKIDSFFIGIYFGKETLGLYALAMQIAYMPFQLVTTGIHRVVYATFSKFIDSSKFPYIIRKTAWLILVFSAPFCIGIYAISDLFIELFFDQKWNETAELLKWLCVSSLIQIYASTWPQFWNAVGKPGYGAILNTFSLILLSFLLYIIGIQGDFKYVPYAIIATSVIRLIIVFVLSKKLIELKIMEIFYESLFPVLFSMSFIVWRDFLESTLLSQNKMITLGGTVIGSMVIYFAALFLIYNTPYSPVRKILSK